MKSRFLLAVGLGIALVLTATAQSVRITEVMANPNKTQGGQKAGEFVELFNLGNEPVDLNGWAIADRDTVDRILPFEPDGATVLEAKAFAVILDPDYESGYEIPPDVLLLRPENSAIGNGLSVKDPLRLLNAEGEIVDTFTPPTSARNGVSFERVDFAGGDVPENWQRSYDRSGTTIGRPSSKRPQKPKDPTLPETDRFVVINEVLFRPEPDAPEWIELFNREKVPIPLIGWTLADERDEPVAIPQTTIPANGYLILTRNAADFRAAHVGVPPNTPVVEMPLPALNDDGDTILLRAENGQRVVDRMQYGEFNAQRGQSLERRDPDLDSDRMDNWLLSVHLKGSTPGAENSVRHETGIQPLIEASPNPFDPKEQPLLLRFESPLTATVTLRIFDSAGSLVRVLLDESPNGGRQMLEWDGKDEEDEYVEPGIYIVQLLAVTEEKPRATAVAVVVAER